MLLILLPPLLSFSLPYILNPTRAAFRLLQLDTPFTPPQLCFRAFLPSTFSSSQPTRDFLYRQALTQSSRLLGFREKVGFRSVHLCGLPTPRFSLEVAVALLPGRRRSLSLSSTPDCAPLETALGLRSIPSEALLTGLFSPAGMHRVSAHLHTACFDPPENKDSGSLLRFRGTCRSLEVELESPSALLFWCHPFTDLELTHFGQLGLACPFAALSSRRSRSLTTPDYILPVHGIYSILERSPCLDKGFSVV